DKAVWAVKPFRIERPDEGDGRNGDDDKQDRHAFLHVTMRSLAAIQSMGMVSKGVGRTEEIGPVEIPDPSHPKVRAEPDDVILLPVVLDHRIPDKEVRPPAATPFGIERDHRNGAGVSRNG